MCYQAKRLAVLSQNSNYFEKQVSYQFFLHLIEGFLANKIHSKN
jgi:hypothetical protein